MTWRAYILFVNRNSNSYNQMSNLWQETQSRTHLKIHTQTHDKNACTWLKSNCKKYQLKIYKLFTLLFIYCWKTANTVGTWFSVVIHLWFQQKKCLICVTACICITNFNVEWIPVTVTLQSSSQTVCQVNKKGTVHYFSYHLMPLYCFLCAVLCLVELSTLWQDHTSS